MSDGQAALGGNGLRTVSALTHQAHDAELVRHLARYRFARRVIAADLPRSRRQAVQTSTDCHCAGEHGAAKLPRVLGMQGLGLDCKPAAIEHAQCQHARENVHFGTADLRCLAADFASEPPAYVVALEVLEHLRDRLEIFASLRWTRPAAVSTPYPEPLGQRPHHSRWDISEAAFAAFAHKAFFYQDMPGTIYGGRAMPPQAIRLLRVLFAELSDRIAEGAAWLLDCQRAGRRVRRLLPDAWAAFKNLARPLVQLVLCRLRAGRYAT